MRIWYGDCFLHKGSFQFSVFSFQFSVVSCSMVPVDWSLKLSFRRTNVPVPNSFGEEKPIPLNLESPLAG